MSFQIPATAKPVALNTAKIYNRHLNHIAEISGIDTIEKIVANPIDVVDSIKILVYMEDDEVKRKAISRMYYSAVFYAMFGHSYLSRPTNILRTSFHQNDPLTTADGKKWTRLAAYKLTQ